MKNFSTQLGGEGDGGGGGKIKKSRRNIIEEKIEGCRWWMVDG